MAKKAAMKVVEINSLDKFREISRRFREIKELRKELKNEELELRPDIVKVIKSEGDAATDSKFIFIDDGIKWQWAVIERRKYDSDAAVEAVQKLLKKVRGTKKKDLEAMLTQKTIIDHNIWEVEQGNFPEVDEAYETVKHEDRLNHWFVSKIKCETCGTVIHRTHKFCFECGATVPPRA